jgi:general stress protein 26
METIQKESHGAVHELKEMVKDVRTAMLCTSRPNGHVHSRPMATSEVDDEGNLWFMTGRDSSKVDEIRDNDHVCVCYASPEENTYVCVMGEATVLRDQAKIDELWNPFAKAWFPEGKEDPNLVLIKVVPQEAEYWNGSSSQAIVLFKMAEAAVTGQEYEDGEHGTLKF